MIKDNITCCWCGFIGLIDIGKDVCPKCNKEGCLKWSDEDNPESEV